MDIEKSIKIECGAEHQLDISELNHFQGKLKTISDKDFAKLKASLSVDGVALGFHAWRDGKGKVWTIDGHHRVLALKALAAEGWFVPPVPVNFVDAKTKKEAAKKVLISNSRYARLSDESLSDFVIENELSVEDLVLLDLPDITPLAADDNKYNSMLNGEGAGSLAQAFGVPPFSILDSRLGYWAEKKDYWRTLIDDKGESRQGTLSPSGSLVASFNDGVSILDPVLAECVCRWFTPPESKILDPFAGDTVFGYVAKSMGNDFTGIELRAEQALLNQKRCDTVSTGSARYINDTSANIDKYCTDGEYDLLFSCPPYYDLEVYSDSPEDLSAQGTYEEFRDLIASILKKAVAKLKSNRFAVIVFTEIRDPSGAYRMSVPDMINLMVAAGTVFYNDIILVNPIGTAALRARRNMAMRKVVRIHQNVLVFYKGDMKKIKETFPKIDAPGDDGPAIGDDGTVGA